MGAATAEIRIDRPPADVWAVVADFGGLASWMPGVESCTLEGDDRILAMMGMKVVERLLSRDDTARVLVYSVQPGGDVPVTRHQATVTVTPDGNGSRVEWAVEVEPDEMTEMMRGVYGGALEALKAHVGG